MSLGAPFQALSLWRARDTSQLAPHPHLSWQSKEVSHWAPVSPGDFCFPSSIFPCAWSPVYHSLERQSVQVSPWFLLGWFFVIVRVPYVFQILDPHQIDLP